MQMVVAALFEAAKNFLESHLIILPNLLWPKGHFINQTLSATLRGNECVGKFGQHPDGQIVEEHLQSR